MKLSKVKWLQYTEIKWCIFDFMSEKPKSNFNNFYWTHLCSILIMKLFDFCHFQTRYPVRDHVMGGVSLDGVSTSVKLNQKFFVKGRTLIKFPFSLLLTKPIASMYSKHSVLRVKFHIAISNSNLNDK